MFLFLSKLLPIVLYPIGLSSTLVLIASFNLTRRPRLARTSLLLALVILWGSSMPWTARRLTAVLEAPHAAFGNPQTLPAADAIVVLGGATAEPDAPRTAPEVNEAGDRLFMAARLYGAKKAPKLILSGGRLRWQAAAGVSTTTSEATDMAQLLVELGVPSQAMLLEPNSFNTRQNAVYVQQILKQQKINRILLVTSAFHMTRSAAIFRRLGITVVPAPTDFAVTDRDLDGHDGGQGLLLSLLPDARSQEMTTKALKEFMGLVVYRLRGWI
jgi:uncharacterized SAM-binding protein YcdF (DUF218 family)